MIVKYHTSLKKNKRYGFFFIILGMLVNYLDLLTYPIVSLGFTLCFYYMMESDANQDSLDKKETIPLCILKKKVISFAYYCFSWLIGYAGMWISKWIISSLILKKNILLDAADAIQFRTSNNYNGTTWSFFDVIYLNISRLSRLSFVLILTIFLISLFVVWRKECRLELKEMIINFDLLLVSLLPFVWYFVLKNHSAIHTFTFRNLSVTCMSIAFWFIASHRTDIS